jgi:hypothetical protein
MFATNYFPVPDLAFSEMKLLERPEGHGDEFKIKVNTKKREESQESDDSLYFLHLKKQDKEANRSSARQKPAAEMETSGKRGRTRTLNESIASGDAARLGRVLHSRLELQEDVKAPAKASSSYFTWSTSGIQSSKAASFPKAPESIQVAAFQFKPGPFRSSSVDVLEKLVNSTIQKDQSKKRVCSEDGNFGTLHLSGDSPRPWYQQAILSSNGAQHGDKRPHPSSRGAENKILGRQRDAQFLPYRGSRELSECSQSERATGRLNSHSNSAVESQRSNNNLNMTYHKIQSDYSASLERLLKHCKHAQEQVTQRVGFLGEEFAPRMRFDTENTQPLNILDDVCDNVAKEVEEGVDIRSGNTESSYAYGCEANMPYEEHDVTFDQTIDERSHDAHDEYPMWGCGIDGVNSRDAMVEDGFYEASDAVWNGDIMKRIDREFQDKLCGYAEPSPEEPPARFWRANKLY